MSRDDERISRQETVPAASLDETVTVPPEALGHSSHVSGLSGESRNIVTPECPGRYTPISDETGDAEIGRGGIGRILAVYDEHLQREVAAKEVRPDGLVPSGGASTETYASSRIVRFLREARITGQLIHPNIVPVYEVGAREDGSLYYTMRLVRGRTFKEALRDCDGLDDRLRLLTHFVDVCNAIAFAHNRGVIHRDIKPDNIMLGEFGETLVLDWGLAKILGDAEPETESAHELPARVTDSLSSSSLTVDGSFMGTPSYASPEQVAGNLSKIDARSDIWALGSMLYEILTGRPPFLGSTAQELLVKVLVEDVVPPTEIDPEIPGDLSSVCLKALDRDMGARYGDARELAAEIEAFRSGKRVGAHDYSPWEHLKRFAAQKKGLIAAVATIALVIVASLVVVTTYYSSEKSAREEAQLATAREQAAREEERLEKLRAAYHFSQAAAQRADLLAIEKRHLDAAIYAAAAMRENPANPEGPLYAPSFTAAHPDSGRLLLESAGRLALSRSGGVVAHAGEIPSGGAINSFGLSDDGKLLAIAGRDGSVRIVGAKDSRIRHETTPHEDEATVAVFSPGSRRLATAGKDGKIFVWETASMRRIFTARDGGPGIHSLAWSPDGGTLAAGDREGGISLFDSGTGRLDGILEGHTGAVLSLAFSPDGGRLLSGSRDRTARIWSAGGGGEIARLEGHTSPISGVAWAKGRDLIATCSYDKTTRVWNPEDGRLAFEIGGFADEVMSVDFSPSGKLILTASWDRSARIHTSSHGALVTRIEAHDGAILQARFTADGSRMVTLPDKGPLRIWSVGSPRTSMSAPGQGYIWDTRYSPDGALIAVATQDGIIRLWNALDGSLARRLEGHRDLVQSVSFSADGERLASGGYDSVLRVWQVATGRILRSLKGHSDAIRMVAFSPDGQAIASAGKEGVVLLRGAEDGEELGRFDGIAGQARAVAFSPDGRWLAAGGDDGVARILEPGDLEVVRALDGLDGKITHLAFSPDSRALAATTWAGEVVLWDVPSWSRIYRHTVDKGPIYVAAFSKDGKFLATGGDDATVSLWNLEEARAVMLYRMEQSVTALDLSAAGEMVAPDGEISVVHPIDVGLVGADPEELLTAAQGKAGKALQGFNLEFSAQEAR